MKLFAACLLLSLPLVFSACAPGQVPPPQPAPAAPPVQVEEPAPVIDPAPAPIVSEPQPPQITSTTTDSITEKRLEKVQDQKTLLQVIREAGVPDDNLTPARREQIAVYQREGKYQFYHFRDSRLIAIGEYPRSQIEQMRRSGAYPQQVIRDFTQLQ